MRREGKIVVGIAIQAPPPYLWGSPDLSIWVSQAPPLLA